MKRTRIACLPGDRGAHARRRFCELDLLIDDASHHLSSFNPPYTRRNPRRRGSRRRIVENERSNCGNRGTFCGQCIGGGSSGRSAMAWTANTSGSTSRRAAVQPLRPPIAA
ncbi:hypothetical protein X946_4992 [Burkholderia sp. ABCPW 111]|nr:hypothetical protein X946_4992 [Burkholderia sp. ABCPW 111]